EMRWSNRVAGAVERFNAFAPGRRAGRQHGAGTCQPIGFFVIVGALLRRFGLVVRGFARSRVACRVGIDSGGRIFGTALEESAKWHERKKIAPVRGVTPRTLLPLDVVDDLDCHGANER